jgi:hypothetical protein
MSDMVVTHEKYKKDLLKVNDRLQKLQTKLINEAVKIDKYLIDRIKDPDDSLYDYEIELEINCYLKEDDPDYLENEDNIISKLSESLKGISQSKEKNDWRWNANHNEFLHWAHHPMNQEDHCWLYHCLYDHSHLSWKNILKVGILWSDIIVQYQYIDEGLN